MMRYMLYIMRFSGKMITDSDEKALFTTRQNALFSTYQ